MADPLSVTSEGHGLLHLGRQITQDLVRLHSFFNDEGEDLAYITETIESIQTTFRSLEIAVQHRQSQANAAELLQKVGKATQRCQETIQELHMVCQKLQTDDRIGPRSLVFRRAYPIWKMKIRKMEEMVGDIREILSLTLQFLHFKSHSQIEDEISSARDIFYTGGDYQCDKSHPPSYFSLPSRQSTLLTTNTHPTVENIQSVIDELVSIFLEDKGLAILYREAIFERRIARARFVRNSRRLLRRFAAKLKEESREAIEINLADIVSSRAGLIADTIVKKTEQQYSQADTISKLGKLEYQTPPINDAQNGSNSDKDEDGKKRALDEQIAELVSHGRIYIKESKAFQKLQEDLKNFIMPSRPNQGLDSGSFVEVESWFKRWLRVVSPKSLVSNLKYEVSRWTKRLRLDLRELLAKIELVEKGIPKDHQRF
ncbi:hypothetical protein N7523_008048 [Penicillium sp. IBT 18751x]|nr:hypothetical protein N7523_008048 [Penicillium sp. IBT 18751x]